MKRQGIAILKYSTRVLSVTRDAPYGKGWEKNPDVGTRSSQRKITSCALAELLGAAGLRSEGRPGRSQPGAGPDVRSALRAAALCSPGYLPESAGTGGTDRLSEGPNVPGSSFARVEQSKQQSGLLMPVNGNSTQSARKSWLRGEN